MPATAQQRDNIGILNGFSNGHHDDLRMKPSRQELHRWIEGRTAALGRLG